MSNSQYEVVVKGVLEGFDEQQVHADFAELFKLAIEKVAQLFSAQRAVIKSGVDEATAHKYLTRLAAIGVNAVAEALPVSAADETLAELETTQTLAAGAGETSAAGDGAADTAAADAVQAPLPIQREAFSFTGNGVEYFKIWIVNLLLNIVTLGIYSAWAKVRNKQYFYGNFHIADSAFEYTAEPIKILKGRVIAIGLYMGVIFANHTSPIASLVMGVLLLIFLPWIIVNSLKFNARHTSYRNIAFRFSGTVGGAIKAFIGWPILGVLSLGILFPFVWKRQAQYITNNHAYGTEKFQFEVSVNEYYKMLLILIVISMGFFTVFAMAIGGTALTLLKPGATFDPASAIAMIPLIIAYIAFYFVLGAYVVVAMNNIHFNNTRLQQHQFESSWKVLSFLGLILTNTLGILFTLGLFVPFAKVRMARYRAEHMALMVGGDLDGFIANELQQSNSLAEGVHDIFDIDISL